MQRQLSLPVSGMSLVFTIPQRLTQGVKHGMMGPTCSTVATTVLMLFQSITTTKNFDRQGVKQNARRPIEEAIILRPPLTFKAVHPKDNRFFRGHAKSCRSQILFCAVFGQGFPPLLAVLATVLADRPDRL